MAKEQGLSLNPIKISGMGGRLMCCLKYEQDTYSELLRMTPQAGAAVLTPAGAGTVTDVNLLGGTVTVKLEHNQETVQRSFKASEVKRAENNRPAPGGAVKNDKQ